MHPVFPKSSCGRKSNHLAVDPNPSVTQIQIILPQDGHGIVDSKQLIKLRHWTIMLRISPIVILFLLILVLLEMGARALHVSARWIVLTCSKIDTLARAVARTSNLHRYFDLLLWTFQLGFLPGFCQRLSSIYSNLILYQLWSDAPSIS